MSWYKVFFIIQEMILCFFIQGNSLLKELNQLEKKKKSIKSNYPSQAYYIKVPESLDLKFCMFFFNFGGLRGERAPAVSMVPIRDVQYFLYSRHWPVFPPLMLPCMKALSRIQLPDSFMIEGGNILLFLANSFLKETICHSQARILNYQCQALQINAIPSVGNKLGASPPTNFSQSLTRLLQRWK